MKANVNAQQRRQTVAQGQGIADARNFKLVGKEIAAKDGLRVRVVSAGTISGVRFGVGYGRYVDVRRTDRGGASAPAGTPPLLLPSAIRTANFSAENVFSRKILSRKKI